jgi:hypothetical protein
MNILLYNKEEEIVSAYTPNDLNYQKDNKVSILGKNYKVTDIEKYRKLNINENVEHVTLALKKINDDNDLEDKEIIGFVQY